MALIVFDGFDHYASRADLQARAGLLQWNDIAVLGNSGLALVSGRGGFGQCVSLTCDTQYLKFGGSFSTNYTSAIMGVALFMVSTANVLYHDIRLMNYAPDIVQMTIRLYVNQGVIEVYSGDPDNVMPVGSMPLLLAVSQPNAFSAYIWNYFEVSATIGAAGSFAIHVGGYPALSGTGVLTNAGTGNPAIVANTGTSQTTFNGIRITAGPVVGVGGSETLRIDDFYLCDTTTGAGSYPCNSFLGDVSVKTLYPTGNSSVQWTPLTGENWEEVSEPRFDGDTTYNSTDTVGNTDLLTFGSLPTTISAIFGVQLTGAYRKLDASGQTIEQEVVSNSTTATAASFGLSLSYAYHTDLFVTDPHTSATWLATAVNSIVAGYRLNT